ncbi:MAG: sulfocyanin-like copper-binding protein, partial [Verrucomicrobiota bacterium]
MQRKRVSDWPVLRASITLGLLLFTCCLFAEEDHSKHPVAGRQLPSPGPESASQFMQVNKEAREAKLTIIATYNDANYGMNFNGHFKGSATYQIPLGWKVIVEFKNMSPVPH